jgi:hypothetical protein
VRESNGGIHTDVHCSAHRAARHGDWHTVETGRPGCLTSGVHDGAPAEAPSIAMIQHATSKSSAPSRTATAIAECALT